MKVMVKKEEKQDKREVPFSGGSEYGNLPSAANNLKKIREKEPIKKEPLSEDLYGFLGC